MPPDTNLQSIFFRVNNHEQAQALGDSLETGDWIGAFNGPICVGSAPWIGQFTSVPAMGDEGAPWTEGYLAPGAVPVFKIFDASENSVYDTDITASAPLNFISLEFYFIDLIVASVPDCNGDLGGWAFENECGCVGGETGLDIDFCFGCMDESAYNYDPGATAEADNCLLRGDLNQDLILDILDLVICANIILGSHEASDYQIWAGDVNLDGSENILDIILALFMIIYPEEYGL